MKLIPQIGFIFAIFLIGCLTSCKRENTHVSGLSQFSPRQVVVEWIEALEHQDTQKLLDLLEKGSWNRLEINFKLYLKTLQELSEKDDLQIKKMLTLQGKSFFEAFFQWAKPSLSQKINYKISEVQTRQDSSTVTLSNNLKSFKLHLIKIDGKWYIQANYLENIPHENQAQNLPQKTSKQNL